VTTGIVGQVIAAGAQAQLTLGGFSALPSQLKSPGAQTSSAYGGCAPRQTPLHVAAPSDCCSQATVPFELVAHHPTGRPFTVWLAGTR